MFLIWPTIITSRSMNKKRKEISFSGNLQHICYLLDSCREAIFLPFWWQLPENWPQAGPTHGNPFETAQFLLCSGQSRSGHMAPNQITANFFNEYKSHKSLLCKPKPESCSIRQNCCQILFLIRKGAKYFAPNWEIAANNWSFNPNCKQWKWVQGSVF